MGKILILSGSAASGAALVDSLKCAGYTDVLSVTDAHDAERLLHEHAIDLLITEDGGFALAAIEISAIPIMALIEQGGEELEKRGILTVPRSAEPALLCQLVRAALILYCRMAQVQTQNTKLHREIEEIRIVTRAKYLLMQVLHMTEPQAHRYIEKQAMDRRITRQDVAKNILNTYDR